MQNVADQLLAPFLLLGNFNAHSPLWGSQNLDNKGKIIEGLLDRNDIALFNDGLITVHNVHNSWFSALDLSISSSSIHLDFDWSIKDYLNGSDHFPIHLRYAQNVLSESPPKWKVEEADWVKFSDGINLVKDFESFDSLLDAHDYFTESTLRSAQASILRTRGKPKRPGVPWWNKTCGVLRKVTRKCYRRYKSNTSPQAKHRQTCSGQTTALL